MQLQSALRAPLRASIPLLGPDTDSVTPSCVKARIASLSGELLAPLRIDILRDRDSPAIRLTSARNINEPLASVIVEMTCGAGIQREYQILLDPPAFLLNEAVAPAAPNVRGQIAAVPETANQEAAGAAPAVAAKADRPVVASRNAARAAPVMVPTSDSQNFSSTTKALKSREHNGLRLTPPSSADTTRPGLELSTALPDPVTRPLVSASAAPLAGDMLQAAAQIKLAASQMAAMQAKMQAMELELVRLRQATTVVRPALNPAPATEAGTSRWWLIGSGLLLMLALGWLGWRSRRLKPRSPGFDWNDEAGKDTIRKATQVALARSLQKRSAVARVSSSMSPDQKVDLQSALAKSYLVPAADNSATVSNGRIHQKNAVAEFLVPGAEHPVERPPEPGADQPLQAPHDPQAFEFNGNSGYVTAGAILQSPFDVDIGGRGRPLMTEAEEIVDVRQQAEFWMSLQDPQRAVQALELYTYEHVQRPDSPLPWLLLFDLYRDLGYQAKYEELYKRYRDRFNSKVPLWDEDPPAEQTGGLETFPRLAQRTCELWNTDEIIPFLDGLLLDDRDGKREGFELPVYNDILFLTELAYELQKLPNLELEPVGLEAMPGQKPQPWARAE